MQDRLTYANGNTITTEGFRCTVGEPIDIKLTVGEDENADLPVEAGKPISNGDYLITLEVNGEKATYRDLYHLGEDTVTIGNYTISDDLYLTGVSEDDEVVLRIEPVELTVTDAFRAAVGKVAPKSEGGGGSGGGVLVVTDTEGTLDKTWQEIYDADAVVINRVLNDGDLPGKFVYTVSSVSTNGKTWDVDSFKMGLNESVSARYYSATSADGYPSVQQ